MECCGSDGVLVCKELCVCPHFLLDSYYCHENCHEKPDYLVGKCNMDENFIVLAKAMLKDPTAKLCEGAWLRSADLSTNQLLTVVTRVKPDEIRII